MHSNDVPSYIEAAKNVESNTADDQGLALGIAESHSDIDGIFSAVDVVQSGSLLPPLRNRSRLNRSLPPGANNLAKRSSPNSLAYTLATAEIEHNKPLTVLRMMKSGLLKDFDECGPGGLTLLGQLSNKKDGQIIPSWNEWISDPQAAWAVCLLNRENWLLPNTSGSESEAIGNSSNFLAASLIFAGADPWIGWARQLLKVSSPTENFPVAFLTSTNSVLASSVNNSNIPLTRLLLSHPNCPTAAQIDEMRIFNVSIPSPGSNRNYHGSHGNVINFPDEPFLHLLVAKNHIDLVKMLLEKGCDVNAQNSVERSPLFYAHTSEMVTMLIAGGASVDIVDTDGKTVDAFWNEHMPTAVMRSAVMRILIEHMSTIKTPQELIEHQKPALFATVLSGTKTDFETIYKKSKFKPDVTWDRGVRGKWSLLTAALMRCDEKTSLFLNFLSSGKQTAPKNNDILPGLGDRHLAVMTGEENYFVSAGVFSSSSGRLQSAVNESHREAFKQVLSAAPILAQTGVDRGIACQFMMACLICANLDGRGDIYSKDEKFGMTTMFRSDGSWLRESPEYNSMDRGAQALCQDSFPAGDMGNSFRKILSLLSKPEWSAERDDLITLAGQTFLGAMSAAAKRSQRTGAMAYLVKSKNFSLYDQSDTSLAVLRKLEEAMDNTPSPCYGPNIPLIALGYASMYGIFSDTSVSSLEKKVMDILRETPPDALDISTATTLNDFFAGSSRLNTKADVHGDFFGVATSLSDRVMLMSVTSPLDEPASASTVPSPSRRRM